MLSGVAHRFRRQMSGFRRSFLGYRPREVDEALAARDLALAAAQTTLEDVEEVARRLGERVVMRERELGRMREELARAHEEEWARALAALGRQLEGILAQARGQATRIRMQALRNAVRLAEPGVGSTGTAREATARTDGAASSGGADADGDAGQGAVRFFEGLVQLDVGPLKDFSQLIRFEDAASSIGAASEISIKRFSSGRATLAMRLDEPVELLRELEERAPLDFKVRSLKDDRVILDLSE